LKKINERSPISDKFTLLKWTEKTFTIIKITIILINLIIAIKILLGNNYESNYLLLILIISQISGIVLLLGLCYKFVNWYRIQPNLVVLIYGFSLLLLSALLVFSLLSSINETILFQNQNNESIKKIDPFIRTYVQNTFLEYYSFFYLITFFSLWVLSTVLLYDHRKEIGEIKFWVIMVIPLIYFLFFFSGSFNSYISSLILLNPALYVPLYQLVIMGAGPLGGIILGMTMVIVSKNLNSKELGKYFTYNAYGISLFFISIQFYSVSTVTYPPFGIFALSAVGLSCFLMFVGIYSTFLYLRMNKSITRVLIKRINQYRLFQNIAEAELIENVNSLVSKKLDIIDQQDFQTSNPSEDSIKEMMEFITEELEKNTKK